MVLPSWISNRQVQQLEHSSEGVLKANSITPFFPTQCPLILAADIPQLSCERHREPAASGQVRMISCHLLFSSTNERTIRIIPARISGSSTPRDRLFCLGRILIME